MRSALFVFVVGCADVSENENVVRTGAPGTAGNVEEDNSSQPPKDFGEFAASNTGVKTPSTTEDEVEDDPYVGVYRNPSAPWSDGSYTHVRVRCYDYDPNGYMEMVGPLEAETFSGFNSEDCMSELVHVNVGTYEDGTFTPNTSMENLYDVYTGDRSIDVIAGESLIEDTEFEEYSILDPLPCVDLWDPEKGLGYGLHSMERECGN
jgi:hypothetical protein